MTALTLSLLMISLTFEPAMASSKGGGSVTQEKVSTGDSGLDKQINKFYSCISKTHQDPPTIEKVDSCYYQGVGGSGGSGGTSNADTGIGSVDSSTSSSTSASHDHKNGNNGGSSDNSGVTGSGEISSHRHHKG